LRAFSHHEFLSFWGYPPQPGEPDKRRSLFKKIELTKEAKVFFQGLFEEAHWESILYTGSWERTIAKLSYFNRRITGMSGVGLFTAMNHAEHLRYMDKKFPNTAWSLTLSLLGNANVFNSLLYKGHFPKKNTPGSSFQFYRKTFDKIFSQGPARQNFLLQLLFFGRILFPEGNPIECDPEVFAAAKKGINKAKIQYIQGNIVEEVAKCAGTVNLVSLSDVPSYFSGDTEKKFMQKIFPGMAPDGIVVIRNYLHVPEGTDYTGYKKVTHQYQSLIDQEKVQMYQIEVFQKSLAALAFRVRKQQQSTQLMPSGIALTPTATSLSVIAEKSQERPEKNAPQLH